MTLRDDQLDRYARHIVLREIGGEGQRRLLDSSVVLVGAGGIGQILWEIIRAFQFQQTLAIMLVIVVAVTLIDAASQQLRRAFI